MAEKSEKGAGSSKEPLRDDTYPKSVAQSQLHPSAPPIEQFAAMELPPSYEEACVAPSTVAHSTVAPVPYYVPLQTGKGCGLLLQFPCSDVDQVSQCFKRSVPNMLLHNGKVLAFLPEVKVFPARPMSAVMIYFEAQRIALSWLQTMTTTNPVLSSRWLAMAVENKHDAPKPGDISHHQVVSIVIMKKKEGFREDKAYKDEQAKLLKEVSTPVKLKYGVLSVVSGQPVFACGDWSDFPAKASELLVNFAQHKNAQARAVYVQEYRTDLGLKRSSELTAQKYSFIFVDGFPIGDVGKFQDL
ncbi:hypothetical protein BsWGS_02550 [Bradybaena similaris]